MERRTFTDCLIGQPSRVVTSTSRCARAELVRPTACRHRLRSVVVRFELQSKTMANIAVVLLASGFAINLTTNIFWAVGFTTFFFASPDNIKQYSNSLRFFYLLRNFQAMEDVNQFRASAIEVRKMPCSVSKNCFGSYASQISNAIL